MIHRSRTQEDAGSHAEANPPRNACLLSAALAGLVGVALSGCADESASDSTAEAGPVVLSTLTDKSMTYERFSDDCDARGGLVQTHAACGGTNACKGMSYNKWSYELTEHTCKGTNTCAGMSCVELAADQGRKPAQIYEDSCSGCHSHGDPSVFTVYVAPGPELAQAESAFPKLPRARLVSSVAFGVAGRNANGVAYSNMPAHYESYSRKEIEAVVQYLLKLTPKAEAMGIVGLTEDIDPNRGEGM